MRYASIVLLSIGLLVSAGDAPAQAVAKEGAPAPARIKMPPDIGAAYGRLGKAIVSHDVEGVKAVWAEDFIVNSPNNTILTRDQVIAAMESDLLDYKDFHKNIAYVGEQPGLVIVMGHDTMVPINGPGEGKTVFRPFTDVWVKRADAWVLVARQATIAALAPSK